MTMARQNRIISRQQLKFALFNFVVFTIIFSIFGIIILSQVRGTLYTKTDEELLAYRGWLSSEGGRMFEPGRPTFPGSLQPGGGSSNGAGNGSGGNELAVLPGIQDGKGLDARRMDNRPPSPRMIIIHWNENGEIVNESQIGTLYYESYFKELQFSREGIGEIRNISISGLYNFRTLSFLNQEEEGSPIYATQLLVNIDAEESMIRNFEQILIFCSLLFILLSMTASYLMSRRTMRPIIQSWNRQAEFVENASHELRTPLTIIQNKLELLLTTPQARIVDKFEPIALSLSETRRLSKLTTDMLTLARADSAQTQFVKQLVNVDELVQNVCAPYAEIAESQDKRLWLSLKSGTKLNADPGRLHQLLVILLDNALKYTEANDSIGITTFMEDHRLVIEVSDTGIGISESGAAHVFDRFYREDEARTRESGGAGLGLAIALWIVTGHQGSIKAIPNERRGTTFRVKLPR